MKSTFGTTDDHPWRSADGRWLRTDELREGTLILRAEGEPAKVVSAADTGKTDVTYNLEVADFHTYFVGENRTMLAASWQGTTAMLQAASCTYLVTRNTIWVG